MTRSRHALALASPALFALCLASCTGDRATTPPTSAVTTPATAAAGTAGPVWHAPFARPEPGLADPTSAPIIAVSETDDPLRPVVAYWSGVSTCFGLDHVAVEEDPGEVRIEVITGRRVPPSRVCTAQAVRYAAAVPLRSPIGDRTVITGAH